MEFANSFSWSLGWEGNPEELQMLPINWCMQVALAEAKFWKGSTSCEKSLPVEHWYTEKESKGVPGIIPENEEWPKLQ